MPNAITVYSFRRCPFAMRVRMTLHEKGIPFEVKEEDLKNFSPELRAKHPEAKVPVLVHGGLVVYESAIITEYLEDAFPQVSLMPVEAGARAEVRLWTYWCNQILKPDLDRLKYGVSRYTEAECQGAEGKVMAHLEKLERRHSKFEWLVGGKFSLADIHVFPFCRQLFGIKPTPAFVSKYPAVNAWVDQISRRESFMKTME